MDDPPSHTLGEVFGAILERAHQGPASFREFLKIINDKGNSFLLIILSLPFCQPLFIPGTPVLFGLAIALLGLQRAFRFRFPLPTKLLNREISQKALTIIGEKGLWLHDKIRRFTKKRWRFLLHIPFWHMVDGLVIALLGLLLALPLPIPLSNLVAAWAIFLISFGMMGDDGLFVTMGYAIGVGTVWLMVWGIAHI